MKKLTNTESEFRKSVAYKKACIFAKSSILDVWQGSEYASRYEIC